MIKAERVQEIFLDCFFKEEELVGGEPSYITGLGVMTKEFGFHPDRLNGHKIEIEKILNELPDSFKKGDSFLNMCMDKHDNHWGEHKNCEQLMALGTAIEKLKCVFPREMWIVLPGNMPYLMLV